MNYAEFCRPRGRQENRIALLNERDEKLAKLCVEHELGCRFTYEDCGQFISLCFEALVDTGIVGGDEPDYEVQDVVCEIGPRGSDITAAWSMTIAKAADYLQIHVPEMVGDDT
jgi:hypothetical protein